MGAAWTTHGGSWRRDHRPGHEHMLALSVLLPEFHPALPKCDLRDNRIPRTRVDVPELRAEVFPVNKHEMEGICLLQITELPAPLHDKQRLPRRNPQPNRPRCPGVGAFVH